MKYLISFLLFFWVSCVPAQFVNFIDKTSENRFTGLNMNSCTTQTKSSSKNYQKAYDCGNETISDLLNLNFLSPQLLGQNFYMFNNFLYWIGKNPPSIKSLAQPDAYFSGSGVFMITLGTSSYFQQLVGVPSSVVQNLPKGSASKSQSCPEGKTLLVAQLKYNDGNTVKVWSQDSICIASHDTFSLEVTSDEDNLIEQQKKVHLNPLLNFMQDPGPSESYHQAAGSPRKIRLILHSAPIQQQSTQAVNDKAVPSKVVGKKKKK